MTDSSDDAKAEIVREYGPYPGASRVNGVSHDGTHVWFASDSGLRAIDPASGSLVRAIDVASDAGTAFDGHHLFQLAQGRIDKIDPASGRVVTSLPAPSGICSGLAWADGALWVGMYRDRRIVQIDPATGEVRRTIETKRFVTGVTWVDGELWHGTKEDDVSDLRRVDPATGEMTARLEMPDGAEVSGVESDGRDLLYCGGGPSGTIRAIRRPRRK